MKRCILASMTVAAVFGGLVASVRADDIYQPAWTRFVPGTTYQDWTFSTGANPSPPDVNFYNLYGTPNASISGTATWLLNLDGHLGVWVLGAGSSMDLFIPNTPYDVTKHKNIQTQITWHPDYTGEPAPLVVVNGIQSAPVITTQVGNTAWLQSVYQTTLQWNPSSEDIIITGTYTLGETVIDTICIPEPSSLALLAVGAVSLLYASRKRRLAA